MNPCCSDQNRLGVHICITSIIESFSKKKAKKQILPVPTAVAAHALREEAVIVCLMK